MSFPNATQIADLHLYVDHIEEEVLIGTLVEVVALDKATLEVGLNGNPDLLNVSSDLIFTLTGDEASIISWDASLHSRISDTGVVTQSGSEVTAFVTATISLYGEEDTKDFWITVLAL